MKYWLSLVMFLSLTASVAALTPPPIIVGGDRDVHGCIGSAGYVWSTPLKKCIRPWEYYTIDAPGFSAGIKKLDTLLQKRTENLIKDFRDRAEESVRLGLTGSTNYELTVHTTLVHTGTILSTKMDIYEWMGGAHGSTTVYTWNYHTSKNRFMRLTEIITPSQMKKISENIYKTIRSSYDPALIDDVWLREGLSYKTPKNYQNWTIVTAATGRIQEVQFYFADYQLGPHAMGMPVVSVQLSDLSISLPEQVSGE